MISIVIVHFRGMDHFRACVRACLDTSLDVEVLVVDNEASSAELGPLPAPVRVIPMERNRGYGAAANRGLDAASGRYVFVINQDTIVEEASLLEMIDVAGESGAALVGPRFVDLAGNLASIKDRLSGQLETPRALQALSRWREVPWLSGAALLFARPELALRFDERFFMYVEDEELCYRAWKLGGSVVLADRARFLHLGGTATALRWPFRNIVLRTHLNRIRMLRWHEGLGQASAYAARLVTSRVLGRARS